MGVKCCFGGTAIQTLKLLGLPRRPTTPSPTLLRAVSASSSAVQAAPPLKTSHSKVVKPSWKAAIDFKWIRENKEAVAANITNRNSGANLDLVLHLYDKMLALQKEVERLRGERNTVASKMKGKLEPAERQRLVEEGKNLKEGLSDLEEDLVRITDELQLEAQSIPNMTHPDVPIGGEDCSTVSVQSTGVQLCRQGPPSTRERT